MTSRTVVLTGASTGIGRATVLRLASAGFTVFAGVRRQSDADDLAAAATGTVHPLLLDVRDATQIAAAVEIVSAEIDGAGLDGLVNNAGVATAVPLEFLPIDRLRDQLEVNLVGQVAMIQAFLPLLRTARGRIVNVSSIGGLVAGGMLGAYHASKFALEAVTQTLRAELRPWGIQSTAIEPGRVATPIWSTSLAASDEMLGHDVVDLYGDAIEAAKAGAIAAARDGIDPDMVARAIEKTLTARSPRPRYPVGTDARVGSLIARLPDRVHEALLRRG